MIDINNLLKIATEEELVQLLNKVSEERLISKFAEYIDTTNLSYSEKGTVAEITSYLLNNLFNQRVAAPQSMELDGFLRYLFSPNDKGISNFFKLGDLNVQTAKIAADELSDVMESERRNILEKLHDDLEYVSNYEKYNPQEDKSINRKDDYIDNMYSRYFEKVPDINNLIESREKTRKNKMLQEQKNNEKEILTEYNNESTSQDLKRQIQALKLLRSKAEEARDFTKVKEYNNQIKSLAYKLRYQSDEGDPIYGKGESVDKKQLIISEAEQGMSNALTAARKYQARLQGKVHQFNDVIDDDNYISGKLSSKEIQNIREQADDINKSLAYTYCAIFDYRLYLLQYTKNTGKEESPDKLAFKEYTQLEEAYRYYSELFLQTFKEIEQKGILKGFPISKEFIGRDLGVDVEAAHEKVLKSRESFALKYKKDIEDVPVNYKYETKLPKVESFLGKSEGKIIKNTPVSNEALVDEKLDQYEDQLQLGDILTSDEKTLRIKLQDLQKQKELAIQEGDSKKVTRFDKDIKTIYQHLDLLSKGKTLPEVQPQIQNTQQVSNPNKFTLDDIDDINMDDIDEAINKFSSTHLETAIENLYIRYAASEKELDNELSSLLGDDTDVEKPFTQDKQDTSDVETLSEDNENQDVNTLSKVKELAQEIEKRIKQFEDKHILETIKNQFTKAAEKYAEIQEKLKTDINFEDISKAIEYYKQNRQKLKKASDISIYQFLRFAADDSKQALEIVMKSLTELQNLFMGKYRQTNGVGRFVLPILEYRLKLEKDTSEETLKKLKTLASEARKEFGNKNSIISQNARYELKDPITQIIYNIDKIVPVVPDETTFKSVGTGGPKGKEKKVGDDPLSQAASKIEKYYKEASNLSQSIGATLGKFVKDDNTFAPVLYVHKVFGVKSNFIESNGKREWKGLLSNGNSSVPNTVGGVDKLSFYKAIRLYPSFLGEVAKMMEKTANEINDTPIKGSVEGGDAIYGYSKTINGGKINSLPGLYKVDHPNYNYKVKK